MTNIYFWGKAISPTFHSSPSKPITPLVSIHTQEIIKTVESGQSTAFLFTDQNQLYAIGSNQEGQMGLSFNPHRYIELSKVFVPTKTKIVSISCGWYHTLILDQLGCLFSSGKGSQGATGQNTRQNSFGFKQVMTGVRKASAGLDHSLAIKGNKVYGWGNTQEGQLGTHSKKRILTPKELTVYPCDQVFAGIKYSIFVTIKGLYGCGMNSNFQLGLGHDKDIHYPKNLGIDDQIVKIWGGNYCFAKNKNSEMYIWGTGAFGVFKYPTKIEFFSHSDHLSLGLNFGIIHKNQKIYVWGSNNFGELGSKSIQIKDYAYECPQLSSLGLSLFSCGKNFTIGINYGEPSQVNDQQIKMNTQCAKDQVVQDFYGDECFENKENQLFQQSLYSSFEGNPKKTQNASIFNQSLRSGNKINLMSSNVKRLNKSNILGQSSAKSEKDKSISDVTVKRMTSGGLKKLDCCHQRQQKQGGKNEQIRKLAQQLIELKGLIQDKSKRNQYLDEENFLLKQLIKDFLLKENKSKMENSSNFQSEKLKEQSHSINQPIQRNPYLKSLFGITNSNKENKFSKNSHSQIEQIESFGSKLEKIKLIMQSVVKNTESDRSSYCQ